MASIARLNQHVAAFLGSTSGLAVGASLGWNSLASQALRSAVGWEAIEADYVCAALPAAAGLGALCLPGLMWMSPSLSSSQAIVYVAAPSLTAGWIVVYLANYSYPMLLLGRTLTGLGVGIFTTLIPLYTSEISSRKHRYSNLVYFHVMLSLGIVCSYASAVYVSSLDFDLVPLQLHSVLCMLASLPAVLCCYIPESLLQRLNTDDSEAVRQLVEKENGDIGDDTEMDREIEKTRKLAKALQQPQNRLKLLRDERFWRVFAVVTCVTLCQHLSGSYPVTFNALTLIDFTGSSQLTSALLSLVCAVSQLLGSILALTLVTRLGRRALLTTSAALMGLALILLGWFIMARETDPDLNNKYSWMPPTWIGLYFGSYGLGLAPLSSALLADSFPIELRVPAASAIAGLGWFLCLALNLQLSTLLMNLGLSGTLWLFAGFCWLGASIAGIAVRESAGKSLADVQEEFRIS